MFLLNTLTITVTLQISLPRAHIMSSNHTLNLHRLTCSSITNFPWLSPTDNWLPYKVAVRTSQHRNHSLGTNLQKTPACITSFIVVWRYRACVSCARSIATVRPRTTENTVPVLLAAFVLRALHSNGSTCHNTFPKCYMCFGHTWQNSAGHLKKCVR
jgi:hypothetical protein